MKAKKYILCLLGILGMSFFYEATAQEMKMINNIRVENIVVERRGDNMVVEMSMILDSLKMKSNQSIVLTPYLEDWDEDLRVLLQPLMLNGRKQHIYYLRNGRKGGYENAIEVRRFNKEPQTVNYNAQVPYQEWMDAYRLNVNEDLCGCGTLLEKAGCELVEHYDQSLPTVAFYEYVEPKMEAIKARSVEGKAFLDFPVNQTVIYPDYRNNPYELGVIMQTIDIVKNDPNISITGIDIHGYASPEGSYTNNTRLAAGRAEALKEYVRRLYDFSPNIFTVQSTPEDWEGMKRWVEASDVTEKDAILDIVNSYLSPDEKDQRIKNLYPAIYRILLTDCYPALRHSDYMVHYVVQPFSIEQAKNVIKTNPSQLSLYEIYQVANSYPEDSDEFIQTLIIAANLFPNDAEANLNAANALVKSGDIAAAKHYLERAGALPQAQLLRGIILMKQGDVENARALFKEVDALGSSQAKENLKLMENFR